jgi:hypothetical protein
VRAGDPAFDNITDRGGRDRDAMLAGRGNGLTAFTPRGNRGDASNIISSAHRIKDRMFVGKPS